VLFVECASVRPDDLTAKFSLSACPVPSEQQPLNEYRELTDSGFFRWAMLEQWQYVQKLFWVWVWSWLIAGPIAAASFPPARHPIQFFLVGAAGASLFLGLTVLRLYLGWSYVRSRLFNPTIFYEESGWYDGQSWRKPPEVLTQDRLVVTYQVQPVMQRLRRTFAGLAIAWATGAIAWNLV
jgi:hypothetical protein